MKTQYYTATSLDGFIADKDNSLEWLFQLDAGAEGGPGDYDAFIKDVGAIAMGSTTYEWILAHDKRTGCGWSYTQPSWVFTSRTLKPFPGADIRFVKGDVRPVHQEMVKAAGGKNVWVVGGGELVGQFHDAGLLDEIILHMAAVLLACGAPLLPRNISKPPLRLLSVAKMGKDFARLHYAVAR